MVLSCFQVPGVDRFFSNRFSLNLETDHSFLRHGEFFPGWGVFLTNGSHCVTIAPRWTRGFRRLWANPVGVGLWGCFCQGFLTGLKHCRDWSLCGQLLSANTLLSRCRSARLCFQCSVNYCLFVTWLFSSTASRRSDFSFICHPCHEVSLADFTAFALRFI